ncbi:type II secretion system protein [Siminovitchia fortis]|uniref:Type II secretion system protein n=1 Tax=Siminovitchia fortis TaxID=254758 RepID=A0A443IUT0_9BACI|nr:type II secretion system protein [Siminovitchia fortis]RWR11854.1 type II secretion system protein [Siminovitchia fortis]WHY81866.1 type II secretion system protein [Siminovitchia fortis]
MKKLLTRFKKDQRGLTLVELLAVVVILAIVAAIAFVMIGKVIENSKKDAVVADAQQMIAAAKLYEANVDEVGTTGVTAKALSDEGFLGALTDPWTKDAYGETALSGFKVTKDDSNVYRVTLTGNAKCNINNQTEADLNKDGRKVCNKD